ncbi:hypothetical protein FRX31_022493 [Thalictrum thalictroides]|uniref:Uncharacterized protein n=1 Tax=Thalictrum thalictroides TaxID=46969 RepID=A0A7J6VT22_THATH|nr:hypothetical protein FRX31_022493 [Thalictrum thalictroides]
MATHQPSSPPLSDPSPSIPSPNVADLHHGEAIIPKPTTWSVLFQTKTSKLKSSLEHFESVMVDGIAEKCTKKKVTFWKPTGVIRKEAPSIFEVGQTSTVSIVDGVEQQFQIAEQVRHETTDNVVTTIVNASPFKPASPLLSNPNRFQALQQQAEDDNVFDGTNSPSRVKDTCSRDSDIIADKAPSLVKLSQKSPIATRSTKKKVSITSSGGHNKSQGSPEPSIGKGIRAISFEEQEALKTYSRLAQAEQADLQQRSNMDWLTLADICTAFYHNSIRERKHRNNICSLVKGDGTRTATEIEVKVLMEQYYINLVGSEHAIASY